MEDAQKTNRPVKVSVILPSHNYRDLVGDAIESVLAQSYTDWELVIVDDGSTDGAAELVATYARSHPDRIRLIFHHDRANRGLVETYRAGLAHARGSILAFIEADDLWYPHNLALKVEMLDRHPDVVVVHDHLEPFGDDHLVKAFVADAQWNGLLRWASAGEPFYAFTPLLRHNFVMTFSSFITRREALAGVDLSVTHAAWLDWWLLAQLSLRGQFISVADPCTRWRLHERSLNSRYLATIDGLAEGIRFKDAIFQLMKRHATHPPDGTDPALTAALRRWIRSERSARVRRWLAVESRATLRRLLSARGYQALKSWRNRYLRRRLTLSLESPRDGRLRLGVRQRISGWAALSDGARITRIEVFYGANWIEVLACGQHRPDVLSFYPGLAHAGTSGFSGSLRVPLRPRRPYRVVAWDDTGRRHRVSTLRLPPEASWLHRLEYELGRWATLPAWWKAVRATREHRASASLEAPLRVLVAGLPKTGTSALYYRIKNSRVAWSASLFEPSANTLMEHSAAPSLIVKVLLAQRHVDYRRLAAFDRKVLIVRDPRDTVISGLLYVWDAPYDALRSQEWLALLRRKEADPASLSVMDLFDQRNALFGRRVRFNPAQYGEQCEWLMRYHDKHPDCFAIRYEDFLDGRVHGLERFLEFPLAPGLSDAPELERVGRTKAYGDWANWFLASDRDVFRPLFALFMDRYGYADDWTLPVPARVDPATASKYAERLLEMKQRR